VRQPQFQRRGQPLAAQLLGSRPNPFHHFLHRFILGLRPRARPGHHRHRPTLQQLDGILPLVAVVLAELVEQPALTFFGSAGVSPAQPFQFISSFGLSLHIHRFLFGVFLP
jgi:hypothetical protein